MEKYTDKELRYFDWLEKLRVSGITNMFAAGPYLADAFNLDRKEASKILVKWMENYEELMELRGWRR